MRYFDLALLERRQVELVINRKRQGVMATFAVSNLLLDYGWTEAGLLDVMRLVLSVIVGPP